MGVPLWPANVVIQDVGPRRGLTEQSGEVSDEALKLSDIHSGLLRKLGSMEHENGELGTCVERDVQPN